MASSALVPTPPFPGRCGSCGLHHEAWLQPSKEQTGKERDLSQDSYGGAIDSESGVFADCCDFPEFLEVRGLSLPDLDSTTRKMVQNLCGLSSGGWQIPENPENNQIFKILKISRVWERSPVDHSSPVDQVAGRMRLDNLLSVRQVITFLPSFDDLLRIYPERASSDNHRILQLRIWNG